MGFKFTVILAVLALTVLAVQGHRRHRHRKYSHSWSRSHQRNRYYHRGPPPGDYFAWSRFVNNQLVREGAFIPQNQPIVLVQSADPNLVPLGIQPANTVFDFSGPTPVQAISPGNGSCFISEPPQTFDQIVGDLNAQNTTIVNSAGELPLDGTATPLTPEQAQALLGTNPALIPLCNETKLVPVYPAGAAPVPFTGPTQEIDLFTQYPALVKIAVPVPPAPPPQRQYSRHRHYSHSHSHRRNRYHRRRYHRHRHHRHRHHRH